MESRQGERNAKCACEWDRPDLKNSHQKILPAKPPRSTLLHDVLRARSLGLEIIGRKEAMQEEFMRANRRGDGFAAMSGR